MFRRNKINDAPVETPASPVSRRKHRKLWFAVGAVVVSVGLAAGAFTSGAFDFLSQGGKAEASNYQVMSLSTGTLSQSVTGTGSISMDGTAYVTVPAELTVEKVNAVVGENVQAGDVLVTLDTDSIQSRLETLTSDLTTLNTELASLSGDTTSSTVKATVKGRVKVIYGTKGADVANTMKEYGALMLLSVDGYMKVPLDISQTSVTLNESVDVVLSSGTVLDGIVSIISDDRTSAIVLVSDKTLALGETVTVKNEDGAVISTGVAEINNPLRITGTAGTIKSVSVSVNTAVSKNSTLMTLTNLPISEDYSVKLAEREACLDEIEQMKAYLNNPVVTADRSGIVKTIDLTDGQALTEKANIVLTTRDTVSLSVSVDELDILKIQEGMKVDVTLDAVEDETFTGTIQQILSNGTTSNNVTTYPVKITLEDDSRFLPGMSATADIVVKESTNALLVPVAALNTAQGQSFVYVYDESGGTTDEPGIRTPVTTGLSDDQYAEVLSGLSPADQVVVVRGAVSSSSSSSSREQQGGMGMMDLGAGSGGMPPSGGSGGGGNRPMG